MNDFPLLTIITITYNAEQFLERTLKSVQAALNNITKLQAVEYLIIDGKSSDNTLEIAKHFSFISNIVSEPDRGLYDAMNKGLTLAKGKYVWFLNAGDEIFKPDTLINLFEAFKLNADIYYSDAMLVRENGSKVGLRSKFTPHSLPVSLKWQDFALGMKVCHQAFIANKSVAPPYDIANLSADIDWEIECLKKAKQVHLIEIPLCCYLVGGLSIKNHRRSLLDRFRVLRKHFGLLPSIYNHFRIFVRGAVFARTHGKYW
ncbi:glycosyltransferase family 2 protein [Dyadobacter fanqingshengii]|uniref:Glycosyltransferase n=1 Tax=Dyadobacter fanqingshengii TaxID=2906443 RepID=A0A9X1P5N6_9BACT|nr:glycosyltransferase family 2 protein [Dyadobacter fanqingshengii]MCF0039279.1 glycosyltransferase [Dyadobacter fanqingshengii]USJ33904.1 glycosyltransferase [Dyadobacter fanqingshengii]